MKKIIFFITIAIPFTFIFSQDIDHNIIGKWKMVKVVEMSKDVTEQHNPEDNRWINFMPDSTGETRGTFRSGKGEILENTGKWVIDGKELFIDSDAGEDDDSYWEITFDNNKMYWKGRKFEFNKRFKIVHRRIE